MHVPGHAPCSPMLPNAAQASLHAHRIGRPAQVLGAVLAHKGQLCSEPPIHAALQVQHLLHLPAPHGLEGRLQHGRRRP